MSGLSAVSASQAWFKPLRSAPSRGAAAPTAQLGGSLGAEGITRAITQALSGPTAAASRTSSASGASSQARNALLNLQAVGGQPIAGQPIAGQPAGEPAGGRAVSASLGGMRHDRHHGRASGSDGARSSGLPAAISSTADDIGIMPNAVQQSVGKAMQAYLASESALATPAAAA